MEDAQLEAELVSPDRGGHIRLNTVERPEVANVLECRWTSLWPGWRPGVRHARIVARRGASNRDGVIRRALLNGDPRPLADRAADRSDVPMRIGLVVGRRAPFACSHRVTLASSSPNSRGHAALRACIAVFPPVPRLIETEDSRKARPRGHTRRNAAPFGA